MYFVPLLFFITIVTVIYSLLKQNENYKSFGIIDVALYILIIIPTASVMLCMFRAQKKDTYAIMRELEIVNERFV